MADPELQCSGLLVVFGPGAALCDLGDGREALAYRADFEMYRAALQRKVSADVVMDPEGA